MGACPRVKCALTAMAMAMDDSVTVSMGDEMRGVFRVIFLVNADVRSFEVNQETEIHESGRHLSLNQPLCKRERQTAN